ncbi:MAG: hypothetical protein QOE44_3018, partial [Solirubrobacteraceae bacterium]|nr:hypothetical protein [Solirubrobacteraceae bacterium]
MTKQGMPSSPDTRRSAEPARRRDAAVVEALELPLNGPKRFWLGFVFVDDYRLGDDRPLASTARECAEELASGRRGTLKTYIANEARGVAAIARHVIRHEPTESPVWVDWSDLGGSTESRGAIDEGLMTMNVARTRLIKALRGGLVIVAPIWAEAACAQGAVDLWSGREFVLRLRSERGQITAELAADTDPVGLTVDARFWRRIAPIAVMRVLREEGVHAALLLANELAMAGPREDAFRLETVAAGLALESGERDESARRALAVIEAEIADDVFAAAIEIAAAGSTDPIPAASLWRRAVDALAEQEGENGPHTLGAMSNLAATIRAQGDLPRAHELLEHVLEARRLALGTEHPDTMRSENDLGEILWAQGELRGARKLHESALAGRRRVLGDEHPDTLRSTDNLAGTLRALGDLQGARLLHEQALVTYQRVRGEEHPDTLQTTNNLASTLRALGDLHGARTYHELVLDARRRVLGDEHPDTLRSMNNLAATLNDEGDLQGARELQERALDGRRRVLGNEHPDTLRSMNNRAVTLRAQGDARAACVLHEQA